jgi:hypothetical protein
MMRQPIPRDLQARIASDIGDYAELIVRRASRTNSREAGSAQQAPASKS